jgi:hypothetical protein
MTCTRTTAAPDAFIKVDISRASLFINAHCFIFIRAGIVAARVLALVADIRWKFQSQIIWSYMYS